jgi:hypothetical protein
VENEIFKYYMGGGAGGAEAGSSLPVPDVVNKDTLANIWLTNEVSQLYLGHPVQAQTWPHHVT